MTDNLTLLLQNGAFRTGWYDETTTGSRRAGHNGNDTYTYYLRFRTPDFDSFHWSKQVNFSLSVAKVSDSDSVVSLHYAILSSIENRNAYTNTIDDVEDANQIVSGLVEWDNLSASVSVKTITVDTHDLEANTEYYLILWSSVAANRHVSVQPIATSSGTIEIEVRNFKLAINQGKNALAVVRRTESPNQGAELGKLSDGDAIYIDDVLVIMFGAVAGYGIDVHTVNGETFTSGESVTVAGNVDVMATAKLQGAVYIGNEMYLCYVGNGSSWDQVIPYVYDSEWKVCS